MRRIIIICLIVVGGVFASKAKGLFQIQTSELRDLGISISCDTDEGRIWMNVNMHDLQVLSLVKSLRNPGFGMITYKDYPESMPILTCNNRPKYKLVKHEYNFDCEVMIEFYDLRQATAPEVDSLSILWSRPPSEIMEYTSTSYAGCNSQMMDG